MCASTMSSGRAHAPQGTRRTGLSFSLAPRKPGSVSLRCEDLRDGHEFVARGLETWNKPSHSLNSERAIGSQGKMSSVVQQNYISAADSARDPLLDVRSRGRIPVITHHTPQDGI